MERVPPWGNWFYTYGSWWFFRPVQLILSVLKFKEAKFVLVGGLTFVLASMVMIISIELLKIEENHAFWYKEVLCLIFKFTLTNFYTWRDRKNGLTWSALKFVTLMLATGLLSSFIFYELTRWEIYYLIAFPLTTLVVMILNYLVLDRIVFTENKRF